MQTHVEPSPPANPYLLGSILAVVTIVIGLLLPHDLALDVLALLLFGIAAVYLGFAVADGRRTAMLVESGVALAYLVLTLAGMFISPWLLVVGYVLHGVWDLLHRGRSVGAYVVGWYIPFCVLYDWIIALFLIFLIVR